jgi:hypothetical protein
MEENQTGTPETEVPAVSAVAVETESTDFVAPDTEATDDGVDETAKQDDAEEEGEGEEGEGETDTEVQSLNLELSELPAFTVSQPDGTAEGEKSETVGSIEVPDFGFQLPELDPKAAFDKIEGELKAIWEGIEGSEGEQRLFKEIRSLFEPYLNVIHESAKAAQVAEETRWREDMAGVAIKANDAAKAASEQLRQRGVIVTGEQLLGVAHNRGFEAIAALDNKTLEEVVRGVTPEALIRVFDLRYGSRLQQKLAASGGERAQTKPHRTISRGGGAAEKQPPLSEGERFMRDWAEGASRAR